MTDLQKLRDEALEIYMGKHADKITAPTLIAREAFTRGFDAALKALAESAPEFKIAPRLEYWVKHTEKTMDSLSHMADAYLAGRKDEFEQDKAVIAALRQNNKEQGIRIVELSDMVGEKDARIKELRDKLECLEGTCQNTFERWQNSLVREEKLEALISWLRDGIQHFTNDDDKAQVEHLTKRIDEVMK